MIGLDLQIRGRLVEAFIDTMRNMVDEPIGSDAESELKRRFDALLTQFLLLEVQPSPQQVTVLLADLRGFSAMTESQPPRVVIDLLNRYFECMSEVVREHEGTIDKFMGDSVMVLFGAPHSREDDLERALRCAVRMQQEMVDLNEQAVGDGLPRLYAGIGINCGEVMAGSFGSDLYREYTVIGDEVNLAARIEGYSLRGQVLLSRRVREQAARVVEIGRVNKVHVKGKNEPVNLYELVGVHEQGGLLEVPQVEMRRSPRVDVDLPLEFQLLHGKQLGEAIMKGRVLDLSYDGMRISLDEPLEVLCEMAFELRPYPTATASDLLYARVLRCMPMDEGCQAHLMFTSVDTPGHSMIKEYVDQLLWGK